MQIHALASVATALLLRRNGLTAKRFGSRIFMGRMAAVPELRLIIDAERFHLALIARVAYVTSAQAFDSRTTNSCADDV